MDKWEEILQTAQMLATALVEKHNPGVARTILQIAADSVGCKIVVDVAKEVNG